MTSRQNMHPALMLSIALILMKNVLHKPALQVRLRRQNQLKAYTPKDKDIIWAFVNFFRHVG